MRSVSTWPDGSIRGTVAPHDKPGVVHAFSERAFAGEIASHPERISSDLDGTHASSPGISKDEWIERQVTIAETVLFRKDCGLCHRFVVREAGSPGTALETRLPVIAPTAIPARWLARAEFDHRSHGSSRALPATPRRPRARSRPMSFSRRSKLAGAATRPARRATTARCATSITTVRASGQKTAG